MRWTFRSSRSRSHEESGVTLVELTVVMLVFGLITSTIIAVMVFLTSNAVRQEAMTQNQEAARHALDLMQKDIRAADPISALTTVALYANRIDISLLSSSGSQVYVRYRLSGTSLVREMLSAAGSSTVTTSQTVATGLQNSASGTPLFRYYKPSGAEMTTANSQPADFANCTVSVHIAVVARPNTTAPSVTAESDAALRNLIPGDLTC